MSGPIDATLRTDPWARSVEPMTPEQYARRRVELVAYSLSNDAIRLNIPKAGDKSRESAVLRGWLLNGAQALSSADIQVVRTALARSFNEPVDPLETPAMRRDRDSYFRQPDGELLVLQLSR